MKLLRWFALGLVVCVSACVTRVDSDTLGAAVRRHTGVGLNHVYYMGSRGGDHFLMHQHAHGSRVYRVSGGEVIVEPTFGFTRDPEAWRLLAERWWPVQMEGVPLVFRETPPVSGASGTVRMTPVVSEE